MASSSRSGTWSVRGPPPRVVRGREEEKEEEFFNRWRRRAPWASFHVLHAKFASFALVAKMAREISLTQASRV